MNYEYLKSYCNCNTFMFSVLSIHGNLERHLLLVAKKANVKSLSIYAVLSAENIIYVNILQVDSIFCAVYIISVNLNSVNFSTDILINYQTKAIQ